MKGIVIVILIAIAGLVLLWWNNSGEVSRLTEQNAELKKQLAEAGANVAAEKATQAKLSAALADTESKLAIVNKKIDELTIQLKAAAVQSTAIAPATVKPAVINVPPVTPGPTPAQIANAAQIKQLESQLSTLKGKSLDLYNKKATLESKIKLESSRMLSNSSSKQFWYYVNEGPNYLHPDNGKYDPKRPIKWVTKTTKDETRANTIKPLNDELASINTERPAVESQIKTIESQLAGLR